MVSLAKRLTVEGAGTAWLVFIGCGSIVLNASSAQQAYSGLEISLAFGLALTTATYALGRLSGAHFNPAVTIGFAAANRFPIRDLVPYIAAQILGAVAGAGVLAYVASGRPGFDLSAAEFGANGFGEHSPSDYLFHSAFLLELVMSFAFVMANLTVSRTGASRSVAPLMKGACFGVIYLVALPVTNASINPARSTGPALMVGDWALDQLWLFWAAPMAGGILAGVSYSILWGKSRRRLSRSPEAHGDAV